MEKNKSHQLSIFSNSGYFSSVFKKAEKITSALYLVTNLFPENEPLKDELRRTSLEVMKMLSLAKTAAPAEEADTIREILAALSEVTALCAVARVAGLTSEMNAAIIGREYAKLAELLEDEIVKSGREKNFIFSSDFFKLPSNEQAPRSSETLRDEIVEKLFEGKIKDIKPSPNDKGQIKNVFNKNNPIKDTLNSRRDSILKLAAEKGNITIKDASIVIRDCSEKTLQREILSLVEEGVLKKEGQRRWSRYSLI